MTQAFWQLAIVLLAVLNFTLSPVSAQNDANPQNALWQNAYCINPAVPFGMRNGGTEGIVSVVFDISAAGKPENIRVTNVSTEKGAKNTAPKALANSAIRAIGKWKYFAFIEDGQEAARRDVTLTFRFIQKSAVGTMTREESCTTGILPDRPSHKGDPTDPLVNLARCMRPYMPRMADANKTSAKVGVTFNIDEDGQLEDIQLLPNSTQDNFAAAALRAVRTWKYHPFLSGGEPIARSDMALDITFGKGLKREGTEICTHAPFSTSSQKQQDPDATKCEVIVGFLKTPELSEGCQE